MTCYSPNKTCHRYLLFLLACHYLLPYYNGLAAGITTIDDEATIRCLHNEREALLEFKHDIQVDRCGLLSSWGDDVHHHKDCCRWQGVQCNNRTSHVTMLALRGPCLEDYAELMWKRKEQRFQRSLKQVKGIDISDNELEGEIPQGISSLNGLIFLNLSRNHLKGSITSKIGMLTSLEFLDLSNNHLSEKIPTSLSQVTNLAILDLSNNNLSGRIPVGTQLQGFDPSSYMGNSQLCGAPLSKCPGDEPPASKLNRDDNAHQNEGGNSEPFLGLYISVLLGFILGFWGVCGTLVIKTNWRHAFFKLLDDVKNKFSFMR